MQMSKMGVPSRFREWLSSWLINRIARMGVNGSIGLSGIFKDGLPQVSFLPPILFTIKIDYLMVEFENTFVSAYADYLLMARSARNKDMAPGHTQHGHLGYQLHPPANLRKFSWRRPELSPTSGFSGITRHVEYNPDRVGSWSLWPVR